MQRVLILTALAGSLGLTGCNEIKPSSPEDIAFDPVRVTALTDGTDTRGMTALVVDGGTLFEQKINRFVANRIGDRYLLANKARRADLFVVPILEDGGSRQEISTSESAVYGQTGIGSISTNGTLNNGSFSGTSTVMPTFGITGYKTDIDVDTLYDTTLVVTAYHAEPYLKNNEYREAWTVECQSSSSQQDLLNRYALIIDRCSRYFGIETRGTVVEKMNGAEAQALLDQRKARVERIREATQPFMEEAEEIKTLPDGEYRRERAADWSRRLLEFEKSQLIDW